MISIFRSRSRRVYSLVEDLKYLNLVCWSLFLIGFVFPLVLFFISSHRVPDVDFVAFYSWGHILNEHPVSSLYNVELLHQVCMQVHPQNKVLGALPYPPFVAMFFLPFSLLPLWAAYFSWILISIALYAYGLKSVIAYFFPQALQYRSLIFCMAFSAPPFILDTAANGHLSAIGFIALAMAMLEDDRGHGFRSGLALSLCTYKPTLLVLLLPMILVTRRFKAIAGFATGVGALAVVTTAFEGFGVWPAFFNAISSFGKASSGAQASTMHPLSKYVDFNSFSLLLHGGRSWPVLILLFAGSLWAIVSLLRFWWESPHDGRSFNRLLWATTITWTLLLNLYVPIYDSIMVVSAILVTGGALTGLLETAWHKWFTGIWALLFVCSWFTVPLAGRTGVQLLTLLLVAFGVFQFVSLKKLRTSSLSIPCLDQVKSGE